MGDTETDTCTEILIWIGMGWRTTATDAAFVRIMNYVYTNLYQHFQT